MTKDSDCAVVGKWRIVEADLWDRDYLDLVEPAYIEVDDNGCGEFAFGCVTGGLNCEYSSRIVYFTWEGSDEMDDASGNGSAEFEDNGTLDIEINFHNGDRANLKARKW